MIVLILAVFYVQHVTHDSAPDAFLFGRDDGWTMAECQASGAAQGRQGPDCGRRAGSDVPLRRDAQDGGAVRA